MFSQEVIKALMVGIALMFGAVCFGEERTVVILKDDFESGKVDSEKWQIHVGSGNSAVEIIDDKKGGKCLRIIGDGDGSLIYTKQKFGDIPYILEFDAKLIREPSGNVGYFTVYQTTEKALFDGFRNWLMAAREWLWNISQQDSGAYYMETAERPDSQTFAASFPPEEWIHVKITFDDGLLTYETMAPAGKNSKEEFQIPIPYVRSMKDFIVIQVYRYMTASPWKDTKYECWIDNVKVSLRPILEREGYREAKGWYGKLNEAFAAAEFKQLCRQDEKISQTMRMIDELLGQSDKVPVDSPDEYQRYINKLHNLMRKTADFYRVFETKLFAEVYEKKSVYTPLDLSPFYNFTPKKPLSELKTTLPLVEKEGIPFRVAPLFPSIIHLGIQDKEDMPVMVNRKAARLFLLAKFFWKGTDKFLDDAKNMNEPGLYEYFSTAFLVKILYENGDSERIFPVCLSTGEEYLQRDRLMVYSITPSSPAPISQIVLQDMSTELGCELYAVTIEDGEPLPVVHALKVCPVRPIEGAGKLSVNVKKEETTADNSFFSIRTSPGKNFLIETIVNKYLGQDSLNKEPFPLITAGFFSKSPKLRGWNVIGVKRIEGKRIEFNLQHEITGLSGLLAMTIKEDEIGLDLTVSNPTQELKEVTIIYPFLKNMALDKYLFPSGLITDLPIDMMGSYGSPVPMQVMAAWTDDEKGGLSVRVEDNSGMFKVFRIWKKEKGSPVERYVCDSTVKPYVATNEGASCGVNLSVQYLYIKLAPGDSFQLPHTVIGFHPGNWREPFNRYRGWVKTWWKNRPCPKDFKYAALCMGGGNFAGNRGYEWGGFDFLHGTLIGWTPDYLEEMKKRDVAKKWCEEYNKLGIGVGAYLDATLLEKTHQLGKDFGEKWAVKDENGNPLLYADLAYRICLSCKEWQEHLRKIYAYYAKNYNLMEVYQDCVGSISPPLCFDKNHGHETPVEWIRASAQLLDGNRKAVAKVSPATATWSEQYGCDYMSQFEDGSWINLYQCKRAELNPSRIWYFHFVIPEFKMIALHGDLITNIKISFFNGIAIGIYGYWGMDRHKEITRPLVLAYRDNADVFNGPDAEPDVWTGIKDVYMNRFGNIQTGKAVWSLANWGSRTRKDAVVLDYAPGFHYVDLTRFQELNFEVQPSGNKAKVWISLEPMDVVYISGIKKNVEGKLENSFLKLRAKEKGKSRVQLLVVSDSFWDWQDAPFKESYDLNDYFKKFSAVVGTNARLIVKLYEDQFLMDEIVIPMLGR